MRRFLDRRVALVVVVMAGAAEAPTWQQRLVDAAEPTPAGVRIQVNASESPVEAETLQEFTRSIAEQQRQADAGANGMRGPNSSSWGLRWNWEMENHLGGCQFKDVTVLVQYNADFATLAGPLASDSTARAWWTERQEQMFATRVQTLKVLRDGAKEIFQKLRMMRSSSCGDLGSRANDVARTHLQVVLGRALESHRAGLLSTRPPGA